MIKRLRFATRKPDIAVEAFTADWPRAVAVVAEAPPDVRPVRVAVCTMMPELSGPDPLHDGIGFEWFTDAHHLRRFEAWLQTPDGHSSRAAMDQVVVGDASPVIIARESVVRGAEWLEQRWYGGGEKLKHMAIALRATDSTPAEFSERWGSHAGQVGGSADAAATVIPADARGLAYVQNHPLPRPTGDWAYDALNEVFFDTIEGLRTRIEWFRENLVGPRSDDLVRQSWFIAAREDVLA